MEVIKYPQIGASFGKTKLYILFQIGHVAKEAAASTLELGNNENGIANAAHRKMNFLPGEGGTNRAEGAPGAPN
jgi:hypothetical protein